MILKKGTLALSLTVAMLALPGISAYADASKQGCESGDGKAAGCSKDPVGVPEPSNFTLLAVGLVVVGGVVVASRRKRLKQT